MSAGLLWVILGLALADSLNAATIVTITLILLTAPRRPVASALSFVLGAFSTMFVLGTIIFPGAGAAAETVSGRLVWLRRIVFLIAAITLLIAAVRRLKDRQRKGIGLPSWFGVGTALPLGVLVRGAGGKTTGGPGADLVLDEAAVVRFLPSGLPLALRWRAGCGRSSDPPPPGPARTPTNTRTRIRAGRCSFSPARVWGYCWCTVLAVPGTHRAGVPGPGIRDERRPPVD